MAIAKKIKPLRNSVSITSNLLIKGLTVYLKPDGSWSHDVADSAVAHNLEQQAELLTLAKVSEKNQYIVGAYPFDVEIINGKASPLGMKETIRAERVPTITPDGLTEKPEWENQFTRNPSTRQSGKQ